MTRVRRAGLRRGAIVLGPLVLLCSAALAVDPRIELRIAHLRERKDAVKSWWRNRKPGTMPAPRQKRS